MKTKSLVDDICLRIAQQIEDGPAARERRQAYAEAIGIVRGTFREQMGAPLEVKDDFTLLDIFYLFGENSTYRVFEEDGLFVSAGEVGVYDGKNSISPEYNGREVSHVSLNWEEREIWVYLKPVV